MVDEKLGAGGGRLILLQETSAVPRRIPAHLQSRGNPRSLVLHPANQMEKMGRRFEEYQQSSWPELVTAAAKIELHRLSRRWLGLQGIEAGAGGTFGSRRRGVRAEAVAGAGI